MIVDAELGQPVDLVSPQVDSYRGISGGRKDVDDRPASRELAAVFDEFFVPRIQPFIDLAHEHGALAMLHSCGDTSAIMPTFVEMGLDILDAMQPEPDGMDPPVIKRLYGDRLTFCGLVSTQFTLPHGSVADVRAEVRERIEVMGAGGGYILSPAHCIQPDTPLENVLAIYEEALGVAM